MMKNLRCLILTSFFLIFAIACQRSASTDGMLPRSTPEAEGISSDAIIAFLDSVGSGRHEFHSIMIVRHGKVIAEGWWQPYRSDTKHTLYSTSKSFTSTAVGFAVSEKLITVDDKVISFFPDQLPDSVSPNLAKLTVKDLLTMSVGHSKDPTGSIRSGEDWAKAFLALPVTNEPGSEFLYNSMATYMLSAIVQKVTGQKIIDYLTPRLFEPLNISGIDWEVDPKGINTGGWGLRIRTEDMAKFGQLYLQKGKWNDRQIIPAAWVEEATTFKIDQAPDAPPDQKSKSDWMQGYCYQFWRCRNNAFRADGAYGQYIIVMPDKDAVIAITAESPDMQDEINLVWEVLLPAMMDGSLPESPSMIEQLQYRLSSLALPMASGKTDSPKSVEVGSKKFNLVINNGKYEALSFNLTDTLCQISLSQGGSDYKLEFGSGKWIEAESVKPGPSLTGLLGGITSYKVAGSYGWIDDTLELVLRYIESPHHETFTCRFEQDSLLFSIASSFAFGKYVTEIRGKAE